MRQVMISIISLLMVAGCFAADADGPERVYRSYNVFGSSIDKLLLETPHVYVKANDPSDCFYVPGFGLVYYSNISMTLSAGLPKMVEQWSEWFSGTAGSSIVINKDKNGEHSIRIQKGGSNEEDEVETSEEGKDESPVEKTPPAQKDEQKAQQLKDMEASDAERLQKMAGSIESFKLEVMELVLDFASILKTHDTGDSLCLVFRVADSEYFAEYGTNSLMVQIPFKDIQLLAGKDVKESSVPKAFRWNI